MLLPLVLIILFLAAYALAAWLHRRGRPDRRGDVLAAGLLALACVGFTWRLWFDAAFMPADGGDLVSFLLPTYRFAAESLRAGQWPLWNPHLYSGAPHVADSQAGFLYPPNLALFFLRPDFGVQALQALSTLHLWWAGLGMFVFVRGLRWSGEEGSQQVGRLAALGAGIAFAFSDSLWIHFGNLNYVAVASWLPWVMACFVRALENGRAAAGYRFLAWAALGGLLLGAATLAGHVQASLFIGITVVLYGLFWLVFELRLAPVRRAATRLAASVLALAGIAALIAAPMLLPALQLTPFLDRAAWSYQETVGYSLSPAQWIGLLIPGFFGRGPQLHWGLWPRVEVGYIGILPLALAALAILARRDRTTWTLLGVSAVAFVLSLGIYSIPHGWLTLLPGLDLLRAPARLVLVMDFGLAALAAIGLQALLGQIGAGDGGTWKALTRLGDGLGWASKAALMVAVPLTLAALLLTQNQDPTLYLRVSVAAVAVFLFIAFLLASWALVAVRRAGWAAPATIGALAVALIFLDLASVGAYNDLSYDDPAAGYDHPEIVSFLAGEAQPVRIDARTDIDALWQPNTALLHGFDDVWGVANPSLLAAYQRYWEGMGSRSTALYDYLGATHLIGRKDIELDWSKFELAFDGDPDLNVYRNRAALPRAFVVHEARVASGPDATEQAWAAVQDPGFDPATQVVIEPGEAQLPAAAPAVGEETVRWLERSNGELALEVTTTAPGYLVLSDVWYPGWQAETVLAGQNQAGSPQPVLRANSAFRAVPLWQAGTQVVRLRFEPPAWRVGWLLAILAAIALAVGAFVLRRRRAAQP